MATIFPDFPVDGPFRLHPPAHPFVPVIFTSPHSGRAYSDDFMTGVRLGPDRLRRSEDCFVDELFTAAPGHGAALLAANFPRVFCDANREAWELDPAMFSDPLPGWANTTSVRVGAGLGTIARLAATGEPIYGTKLPFAEAERRFDSYWRPFHDALTGLIGDIHARFGYCLIVDCHSMPSNAQTRRGGGPVAEFVLGDLHGVSCAPRVTRMVETVLAGQHFHVRRNDPYAGGYITRHYGRPAAGVHVLQVEIVRSLYMDEETFEKSPGFSPLQRRMGELTAAIAAQLHDLIG